MRTLGIFVAFGLASATLGQWETDKDCMCISECEVAAWSGQYVEVVNSAHMAVNGMFASGQFNDPKINFTADYPIPEDFKPTFWNLYSVLGENKTNDVKVTAMLKYAEDDFEPNGIKVWIPTVNVWKDNKMKTITREHCDYDVETSETKVWEFGGNPNNSDPWIDNNGDMVRVTISCSEEGSLNVRIKKWDRYEPNAKKVTAKKLARQRKAQGICVRDKYDQGASQDIPNMNASCKCITELSE